MNDHMIDPESGEVRDAEVDANDTQPRQDAGENAGSGPFGSTATAQPVAGLPAEAMAPSSAGVPAAGSVEDDMYHQDGTWNGLPRWACKRCAFDTVDNEDVMLWHITKHMGELDPAAIEALSKMATSHSG